MKKIIILFFAFISGISYGQYPVLNAYSLQLESSNVGSYGIYSDQTDSAVFGMDCINGNSASMGVKTNGTSEIIIHGNPATEVTIRANDTISMLALNSPDDRGKMVMTQNAERFTLVADARSGVGETDRGIKIIFPSYSEYSGAGFFELHPPKKNGTLAVESAINGSFLLCNGTQVIITNGIITNIIQP